ncbi:MAG TPA: hypothetical protein VNY35_10670 [Solirubrobacteraceae bacterium]|nr:hypothetical protein [Solirubrobacteraceae bacterium]
MNPSAMIRAAMGRRSAVARLALGAYAMCLSAAIILAPASARTPSTRAAVHYACSAHGSAHVPCHFSTPSGNIRCLWTPKPNNIACELLATGRAYRLRPTGGAKRVKLKLLQRGETLPTSQLIVFPESLSCRDTRTAMTCNQDFGLGEFKLAPSGSHGS